MFSCGTQSLSHGRWDLVPLDQGSNPRVLHWECGVSLGTSRAAFFRALWLPGSSALTGMFSSSSSPTPSPPPKPRTQNCQGGGGYPFSSIAVETTHGVWHSWVDGRKRALNWQCVLGKAALSPWECLGTRSVCDKGLERGGRAWLGHTWVIRAVPPQVADGEVKASTLQLDGSAGAGPWPRWRRGGPLMDKVQSLTRPWTQSSASLASTQDKNVQLQKALTACEHDRQVLQHGGPRAQLWGARWE